MARSEGDTGEGRRWMYVCMYGQLLDCSQSYCGVVGISSHSVLLDPTGPDPSSSHTAEAVRSSSHTAAVLCCVSLAHFVTLRLRATCRAAAVPCRFHTTSQLAHLGGSPASVTQRYVKSHRAIQRLDDQLTVSTPVMSASSLAPPSSDDSDARVYFEPQESALCAVHALNNLVQSPLFTAVDLSSAAADLQEQSRQLHAAAGLDSADYLTFLAADSEYVSDEGNFSLECITACLSGISCELTPLTRTPPQPSPGAIGLIANLESHWLALRRIEVPPHLRSALPAAHSGAPHVWLNLNSLQPRPSVLSDTFLSLFLAQLQTDGYAVFECTASNAELMEGALMTSDVVQCESARWLSLRSILTAVHSTQHAAVDSRTQPSSVHSGDGGAMDEFDDEKAMQAAIKASMQGVSSLQPIVLDGSDHEDEDADLKAAIALSMAGDPPNSSLR